ncbi:MAG: Asp-tRNA(Asn)/Glu-tRNA(Gln) amidotransferase subunit GatC [Pseudobdellovibrionaceae bacterium]
MIDKKTIEHIAHLSRLSVSDEESTAYSQQLSKILDYFQQMNQLNTDGVEPLLTPSEIEIFWREDVVQQLYTAEEMTANAPEKVGHLFKVPPVV